MTVVTIDTEALFSPNSETVDSQLIPVLAVDDPTIHIKTITAAIVHHITIRPQIHTLARHVAVSPHKDEILEELAEANLFGRVYFSNALLRFTGLTVLPSRRSATPWEKVALERIRGNGSAQYKDRAALIEEFVAEVHRQHAQLELFVEAVKAFRQVPEEPNDQWTQNDIDRAVIYHATTVLARTRDQDLALEILRQRNIDTSKLDRCVAVGQPFFVEVLVRSHNLGIFGETSQSSNAQRDILLQDISHPDTSYLEALQLLREQMQK